MKLINKIKTKFKKPRYAWIICHTRATDYVYFGPFYSYKELDEFYSIPANKNIQSNLQLLILPTTPPDKYWYNPLEGLYETDPYLFD